MTPAIEIVDLRKSFGNKEVLRGVCLAVPRGSLFGFLGPNGAGKTTTISIVTGILSPTSGTAHILGEKMTPDNERLRRRIGVVYDSQNLFEQMTAAEHLTFSAGIYGVPAAEIPRRREELLALLDLEGAARVRIREYSHGMKKKTALACALIHDPEVLLLDEPFEGMDAPSTLAVIDNLTALARRGTTIFVTSHVLDLVERLCDSVAILHEGTCVYQEPLVAGRSAGEGKRGGALEDVFLRLTSGDRQHSLLSWTAEGRIR